MDEQKRARIEAKGFRIGTVAAFLGLTEAESAEVELRLFIANAERAHQAKAGPRKGQNS